MPFSRTLCGSDKAILLLLGFSSGLPLALTSGTLQAWMTVENFDLKTIGLFSLVGQAYVFKFLWSPLMDLYALPFLGRRLGWLFISQLLLIAGITAMGFVCASKDIFLIASLAAGIAFCSASQDIVFDAWKTDILPVSQRGRGAAISVLGYRLAMLVSGGLALWLADRYLGWHAIWWLMAIVLFPSAIATLYAKEADDKQVKPQNLHQAVAEPLCDFFNRNNAWLILCLIILYKLGDTFTASLSTTFLIRVPGFDAGQVGVVNKTFGLLATITGVLYGGIIMQRLTLFRALMIFGLLQAVSNLGYWLLSVTDKHMFSMASVVFIENLCGGMGTAAFVALLMSLCRRAFSATQFALLSALSAAGRIYVGPVAGWLVELWGWSAFYAFSAFVALPGLALLAGCRYTLQSAEMSESFVTRTAYPDGYRWAFRGLAAGFVLLAVWLVMLAITTAGWLQADTLLTTLSVIGFTLTLGGVSTGAVLDYFALTIKKKRNRECYQAR